MKKILFMYENNSPSAELMKECFEAWKTECCPMAEIRYLRDREITERDINWCDCLLIIRGLSPYESSLCKVATKRGVFCILILDDDMLNTPAGYPILKRRKKSLCTILKNCDFIIASNSHLADKYSQLTRTGRYVLIDTIVNKNNIVRHKDNNKMLVRIVYAASKSHASLFEKYVAPVLVEVKKESNYYFDVTCVGNSPNVEICENNVSIKSIPPMSMKDYKKYMGEQNFDIGLAPLFDDEFSHCKYYNKFVDYATYGIVGIYSNCEPYTQIVKNKENGILCDNTAEGWKDGLLFCINNKELRNYMREQNYKCLKEIFSPEYTAKKIDSISELQQHEATTKGKWGSVFLIKLNYVFFKIQELFFFLFLHLKRDGIIKTGKRIIAHVKQVKSYGSLKETK